MVKLTQTLTKRTGLALGWSYAGMVTRILLSLGINILLARLLGPGAFGQLTIASIPIGLGQLISNVGLTSALIQRQELTEKDVRFCFTAQMSIAICMAGILALTAPLWAAFFRQPAVIPMFRWFSLFFVFQAVGSTSVALLERDQDTRTIQLANITSYVIGYLAIGVTMASRDFGVWSLIAAQLTQSFVASSILYGKVRHSVLPTLHPRHYHFLAFGSKVLGANIANWAISNLDNTFVGRYQGLTVLGLYSRAFGLAAMPSDAIIGNFTGVLLPPMSRVQSDHQKLRRIYSGVMGLLTMIVGPIFLAAAVASPVIIVGLYGQRWVSAIPLFRPLAMAIPFQAAMALSGPVLAARGKPQRELQMQLITAVFAFVTFRYASMHSVVLLSWVVLVTAMIRCALMVSAVLRELDGRWSDLFSACWPSAVVSGASVLGALLLQRLTPHAPPTLRLILVAAGAGVVDLIVLMYFGRVLLKPIFTQMPQLSSMLPSPLRARLVAE